MNKSWVEQKLDYVIPIVKNRKRYWKPYNPSHEFYASLESGEDQELINAVTAIGKFIAIKNIPLAIYEWGLKMKPEIEGQIHLQSNTRSIIKIPLFNVGKPYILGAIIAHELSHAFLSYENIPYTSIDEQEMITDLTSIALGLGKLVLNGIISEIGDQTGEKQIVGYIKPELLAFAYQKVNQYFETPENEMNTHLIENALYLLKKSNYEEI